MSITSRVKRLIALGIVAGALVVAIGTAAHAGGARTGAAAVKAAVHDRVDPNAFLPPARPFELAKIRRAEAREREVLNYPPARERPVQRGGAERLRHRGLQPTLSL